MFLTNKCYQTCVSDISILRPLGNRGDKKMPKRKQDLSEQLSNWHKTWLACKAPQHIPTQRRFNQNYSVPFTSAFLESCATLLSGRLLPSYKQLLFHVQKQADVRPHQDPSCCVFILSVCLHLLFWRNSCVAVSRCLDPVLYNCLC